MFEPRRVLRVLASSAIGIAAGAAIAAALSSQRRRAWEASLRERWRRARAVAEAESARTEAELWARFRQLVGLSTADGTAHDFTAPPPR
ncbi:MAG: hypothetical protein NZL87_03765 [Thermomicrobium sp.]|nr:hypothetical protein [Thermomicrobium sp.]MDW7981995.1 hypothetical protein [Thermomicrobium sp.]